MSINNNRIKLSAQCCVNCGKSYKKRENLDNHIIFCDLLQKGKKSGIEDDDDCVIPSTKNMYKILIELGKKYNKLEEQMSEMTKFVSKKKKKINVVEWLTINIEPKIVFERLLELIIIKEEDAVSMLENSFYDVLNEIFSRSLFCLEDKPIFTFAQKVNTFYSYQLLEDGNKGWVITSREKLMWIFNKIHMKLVDVFYSWKKVKLTEVGLNKDKFEMASDKALLKLMTIDFRVESIFSKTRCILFNGLKKDMKVLVDYEFD
jgi:hypothetical protein